MTEKRHLKVIATPAHEEAMPRRSRGQWTLLGAALVAVLWLPLGMLGLWASRVSMVAAGTHPKGLFAQFIAIAPIVGSYVLAAYLGGLLVIRFGPERRLAIAALSGALAGALVASLAAFQGALSPWPIGALAYAILISVGGFAATLGGRHGRKLYYAANVGVIDRPLTESRS